MLSYSHCRKFLMYTGSTTFTWSFFIFRVEPDAFFCLVIIAKTIEPTRIFDSCFKRQTEKTTFPFTMNDKTNLFHFCFNLWPVNPLPGNKWGTGADVKIKNSNERKYTLRFWSDEAEKFVAYFKIGLKFPTCNFRQLTRCEFFFLRGK